MTLEELRAKCARQHIYLTVLPPARAAARIHAAGRHARPAGAVLHRQTGRKEPRPRGRCLGRRRNPQMAR